MVFHNDDFYFTTYTLHSQYIHFCIFFFQTRTFGNSSVLMHILIIDILQTPDLSLLDHLWFALPHQDKSYVRVALSRLQRAYNTLYLAIQSAIRSISVSVSGRYSIIPLIEKNQFANIFNDLLAEQLFTIQQVAQGKCLILSLTFPPLHTVRATFTAHGVPSKFIQLYT